MEYPNMQIENGILKRYIIDENDPNIYFSGYGIPHGSIKILDIPNSVHEIGDYALSGWYIHKIIFPESIERISESAFKDSRLKDVFGPKEYFNQQDKSWFLNRFGAPESMYFNGLIDKNSRAWSYFADTIKRKKWEIFIDAGEQNNVEKLALLLDVWKKVSLKDLDAFLAVSIERKYVDFTAYLTDYKNKFYPPKVLDMLESDKIEKQLGFKEMSVSDWRNVFRFSIRKGTVKLLQYIADDAVVVVPEYIGKNKVVKIEDGTFYKCNLQTVTLPESIEEIGKDAFAGCSNFTIHVTEGSPAHQFALNADLNFVVEEKASEADHIENKIIKEENTKRSLTDWREIYGKIAVRDKSAVLGKYRGKESVVIVPAEVGQNKVLEIAEKAFYKNNDIKEVTISEGIKFIGDNAFSGCKNLVKIKIPGTITEFGTDVFKGCTALKTIEFASGADYFYMWIFEGCKKITDIILPTSVEDIEIDNKKNLTIHAPAGSYAETYANENNISFVMK